MVKNIVRDMMFLAAPSAQASAFDNNVAADLEDTLKANAQRCVGLAANMIGVRKRVIAVSLGISVLIMYNPVITAKAGAYKTTEGCLSLEGERETTRYSSITVEYHDRSFKKQKGEFKGYVAQIIQHEIDHCNGIII